MRAVLLFIIIYVVTLSSGQREDHRHSDLPWSATSVEPANPFKPCNRTTCFGPCEGAAPPPFCPSVIPHCPSGCACTSICPGEDGVHTIICYQTTYCIATRRRFLKRRKTTIGF